MPDRRLRTVRAVLFDMDGTLVDSGAAVDRAWARWASEHGVDPALATSIAPGRPASATVRDLLRDADEREVVAAAARQLALQYEDMNDVVAAAGAAELIGVLARLGLAWAVVTSADRRLAHGRLEAAGLGVPRVLVTCEDVRSGKPDPEGYLQASARIGVDPGRCLVVEDSAVGVQAGLAAGAPVAALNGLAADVQFAALHELAALLLASRGVVAGS